MLYILYGAHHDHDSHTRRRTATDCHPVQDDKASHSYLIDIVVIRKAIIIVKLTKAMAMLPQSSESIKPRVCRTLLG